MLLRKEFLRSGENTGFSEETVPYARYFVIESNVFWQIYNLYFKFLTLTFCSIKLVSSLNNT